ncbi:hypothetical protein Tco_0374653 [Tanacetum coccineum]
MLKFLINGGIVTIRSTILIPAECATVTTSSKKILREAEVRHENLKVALHPNFLDQKVPIDMTGVPRSVAEHRLNIREGYSPVRQKKRGQAPEFMVKKHDGSWRMCVDFTDLNKACPQDCYPLPEIDWKVESLCGYPFKCFLDAYKRYHQIQMTESDEDKTAFHTSQGEYCYIKMPFGLKNADATYQLVDKAFVGTWTIAFDSAKLGSETNKCTVDDLDIKSPQKNDAKRY